MGNGSPSPIALIPSNALNDRPNALSNIKGFWSDVGELADRLTACHTYSL